MDYKEYKISRNLAWDILLKEEVKELPVKVSGICSNMGIALKNYKSTDGNSGFCAIVDGRPYIFVDSESELGVRRYTAAHELGHILLGHVGEFTRLKEAPYSRDSEKAAESFALRLLAPACVLWGCEVKTAEEIMRLCGISSGAAENRMIRMKILYKRNKFLLSPAEKEVYERFWPFIYRYRQATEK